MARKLQSDTFTSKKRKRFYWTLALIIVVILSWLRASSSLTHLSALKITDVKIFGADADITPALQSAAEQTLTGKYFGLFYRDSTLIYPRGAIIAAVKAASPRILNVSISRDGLRGLIISVSQKIPAAIICATLPDFENNRLFFDQLSGCYMADASGFLFEAVPPFTASSSTRLASTYHFYYAPDLTSIDSYATSTAEFWALQSFYDGAKALGISPEAILIKEGGEYEMYASTMVIYFNDSRQLSDELANLAAFWKNMKGPFDYIDLRYGDNVFYKLIN